MHTDDKLTLTVLTTSGNVVNTVVGWQVQHSIILLDAELGVRWFPIGGLFISCGVSSGLSVSESRELSLQLLSPADAVFSVNNSRKIVVTDSYSTLPSTPRIAATLGVGYTFMFGESGGFLLSPELNYSYGLTSVKSGYGWKFNTLSCGITACIAL